MHHQQAVVHKHNHQAPHACSVASLPSGVPLPRSLMHWQDRAFKRESEGYSREQKHDGAPLLIFVGLLEFNANGHEGAFVFCAVTKWRHPFRRDILGFLHCWDDEGEEGDNQDEDCGRHDRNCLCSGLRYE